MNALIDTAGIAELLSVTRAHATDVLTKQPDFPAPVINRSRRMRKWAREAVMAWAAQPRRRANAA